MTSIAETLRGSLADPGDPALPSGIPAAVLIPVLDLPEPAVLLTRRTELVRHHKGEISFPGGARHPEDGDLLTTALRETEEELGIPREAFDVPGALAPTPTIATGYVIVPFVGVLRERPSVVPSDIEIAEVIELPLARLAEVERAIDGVDPAGRPRSWFAYELDGYLVWGATGRIMHELLEMLAREGWVWARR